MEKYYDEKKLQICDSFISDLYEISEILFPDLIKGITENLFASEVQKDPIGSKIIILKNLMVIGFKNKINIEIYKACGQLLDSIAYLRNGLETKISQKNNISLFVQVYYTISVFDYIVNGSKEPLKTYKIYPKLSLCFKENQSSVKTLINIFLQYRWKSYEDNDENKIIKILKAIDSYNFEDNFESIKKKKNEDNRKKKEQKKKKILKQIKEEKNDLSNSDDSLDDINCNNKKEEDVKDDILLKQSMDEIKQDMEMDKDNMEENNKNNIDDNAIKNKIGQNKNNIICDNNNVIEENIYNNNCIINENNIEEKNKEDNNGQTTEDNSKTDNNIINQGENMIDTNDNNQSQIETNIIYDDKKDFMNNINECNNNDNGLKSNENNPNIYKYVKDLINTEIESLKGTIESQNTKLVSQDIEIKSLKGTIESQDAEIKSQKSKLESQDAEIKSLKQDLKEVKEEQRFLWCQFCLATNSRDIFKSITYYLYTHLKLKGDSDN